MPMRANYLASGGKGRKNTNAGRVEEAQRQRNVLGEECNARKNVIAARLMLIAERKLCLKNNHQFRLNCKC